MKQLVHVSHCKATGTYTVRGMGRNVVFTTKSHIALGEWLRGKGAEARGLDYHDVTL